MKHTGRWSVLVLIACQLLAGCTDIPIQPEETQAVVEQPAEPAKPTKEILINNDRFDRPYSLLGQVEYTAKSPTPVDQSEIRNQAINSLKNEAFTKYGDKVDAIIDTKVEENLEEGENPVAVTHVQGIAISFDPDKERHDNHKKKRHAHYKRHYPVHNKTAAKKHFPHKSESAQTQITPTEMLK